MINTDLSQLAMSSGQTASALASKARSAPASQSASASSAEAASNARPADRVNLSPRAQDLAQESKNAARSPRPGEPLSEEQEQQVAELKRRDTEVRNHEQAHQRVGGQYASAPSYEYQTGPDNKQYAVGGEVQIDVSPVEGDPDATIDKMRIVKAAALAPAEPSGQDRKVAAMADAQIAQALAQKAEMKRAERQAAANGETQLSTASAAYSATMNNSNGAQNAASSIIALVA